MHFITTYEGTDISACILEYRVKLINARLIPCSGFTLLPPIGYLISPPVSISTIEFSLLPFTFSQLFGVDMMSSSTHLGSCISRLSHRKFSSHIDLQYSFFLSGYSLLMNSLYNRVHDTHINGAHNIFYNKTSASRVCMI